MKKTLLLTVVFPIAFNAISQNGKVGIGTTSPLARLHVTDSSVLFSTAGDIPPSPGSAPISGAGRRMMWFPERAAFRSGYVSSTQWDNDSIGYYSVAAGINTKATNYGSVALGSGTSATSFGATALGVNTVAGGFNGSTAIGVDATATGNHGVTAIGFSTLVTGNLGSSAIGYNSVASGNNGAIAIGYNSIASGNASFANGDGVKSKSYSGFAAGTFNDTANVPSSTSINSLNRVFQIGNGTANNARKNAMTVLQNGNAGFGTVNPLARLHVADSNVLFSATESIPGTPGNPPVSGAGRRMMWYADKAAFRSGYVSSTQWDNSNTGNYSFATGFNTKASGGVSFASGDNSEASGYFSTAMGENTTASGSTSTAMGYSTTASGDVSTSLGSSTTASGDFSASLGSSTTASGTYSTAMGLFTTASGNASTAMGYQIKSKSFAGTAVGIYNDSTNAANSSSNDPLNRIFQIGNGTAYNARSNAMTVLQNGNIGIGEVNPAVPLNFTSGTGNKISLWGTGTNHYGFGIQASLLQIYTMDNTNDIAFGYGNSNAFTETMRIKGNGNVGIGTSTPGQKLSVAGGMNIDNSDANAGTLTNSLRFGGNSTGEAIGSKRTAGGNQYGMDFYTSNTNRMSITQSGNVGIGTSSPSQLFSVAGGMNIDNSDANAGTVTNSLRFGGGSSGEAIGSRRTAGANQWGMDIYTGSIARISITNGGDVGIGTTTPSQRLHVAGNICYTGSIAACSDIRYKKDFTTINHPLQKLLSLQGMYYNWRVNEFPDMHFTNETQIGFAAQEVERFFPELVITDSKGYKSVDYGRLTPVLVEAIKEQQQMIDMLIKEIKDLKSRFK